MSSEPDDPASTRALLDRCHSGDGAAVEELYIRVQEELRRLARLAMNGQGSDHTLQATALVHEAWIRLVGADLDDCRGREHFLASAARAIRSVLVDHARRKQADKRPNGERWPLLDGHLLVDERAYDLVDLDDALQQLARRSEQRAKIVELRFFAGMSIAETAAALGVGTSTVDREWRLARMFLREQLAAPPKRGERGERGEGPQNG